MTNFRRIAFITFTIVWTTTAALAQPAPRRLLELASGEAPQSRGSHVAATRRALGRVDARALFGDRIELTPFADIRVVARRTSRSHPRTGSTIWHGKLEAPDRGEVTLALVNGVLAGTLTVDGRLFEIGFAGGGLHEIQELNPALFPTDDPPLDLISSSGTASVSSTTATTASGGQIDVMVVWTPAARNAAGGTAAAIQSVIDLAVANANASYVNSQVATSLRLVYSSEVSFAETPSNILGDLTKLAGTSDGQLDQIHTLRNQYGADIVTLIGSGYAGYCGIGYLMSSVSTAFANSAFNVVERSCAAGNLSYAHEVGHNQGLHHDPPNAGGWTPSYPYAYGYQDTTGAFRTVMSYGSAPRIQRLSNPNVFYNGRPTGTAAQDNARALNANAATVANFRSSSTTTCSYTLTPTTMSFSNTGGTATVNVTTTAGCSWTTSSASSWVSVGPGGSGSGSVVVNVAPNTSSQRSTTIAVAGTSVSISEAGATSCTYTVNPTSLSFSALGGTATVNVSASTGCSWTTGSGATWASVTPGGSGSGPVTVTTSANGATSRTATVTVAGQAVTVTQAAATNSCTYTVSPLALSLPASGGSAQIVVTTGTGCGWTARSNTGWLKVSGSGSGPGIATLQLGTHPGGQRTATALVAGRTVTVTQLAAPKK